MLIKDMSLVQRIVSAIAIISVLAWLVLVLAAVTGLL